MGEDASECAWVERLRAGDQDAWDQLVKRYGPRMLAVARSIVKDEDAASDVWQDALISVYRSIGRFGGEARLATWLHRIVVNACLMSLRSRRRQPLPLEHCETLDASSCPYGRSTHSGWPFEGEARVLQSQLRVWLWRHLERLPDVHRSVIVLRDLEDRSSAEVAALLGTSPNAVKIRLHRARRALRASIGP